MAKKRKPKHPYHFVEIVPTYYHTSRFALEISTSTIANAGSGVFAKEDIPEKTQIDYYTGQYSRIPLSRYYVMIREDWGIDAGSYPRCYMGMLNDSFTSTFTNNCTFEIDEEKDLVSVWSTRKISAGEELFISYGDSYWNS